MVTAYGNSPTVAGIPPMIRADGEAAEKAQRETTANKIDESLILSF